MDSSGRVALITGGASGLGRAAAEHLRRSGMTVVIADVATTGREVAERIGGGCVFVRADVRDETEVQHAVDTASALGSLAVVVTCAGIADGARVVGKSGPHSLEVFRRAIEINLIGTFNVVRLAASRMVDTPVDSEERGVIVMTASVAAFDGQIGQAAYSASKGGVVGMTLPIARDLAQHRIRVMSIAPGLFLTPMFESLPADAVASLGSQVPHPKRLGQPREFAQLVEHIVANPMLNGEVIRLDGAIRMAPR